MSSSVCEHWQVKVSVRCKCETSSWSAWKIHRRPYDITQHESEPWERASMWKTFAFQNIKSQRRRLIDMPSLKEMHMHKINILWRCLQLVRAMCEVARCVKDPRRWTCKYHSDGSAVRANVTLNVAHVIWIWTFRFRRQRRGKLKTARRCSRDVDAPDSIVFRTARF